MDYLSPFFPNTNLFENLDSNPFYTSRSWPDEIGEGGVKEIEFSNDFRLKINDSNFVDIHTMESELEHYQMEFCFCISGHCKGEFGKKKNRFVLESGKSGIFFSKRPGARLSFGSDKPFKSIVIQINPSLLFRWFKMDKDFFSNKDKNYASHMDDFVLNMVQNTRLIASMAVEQILSCPFSGDTGRLYLESKAMELVAILTNQMVLKDKAINQNNSFTLLEKERIYHARDILVKDLENPPTLAKLSLIAGLNKNLLNNGFKEFFGTTVFDYLRNFRLEKAKEWIEEEGMETSITEIAFRSGYSQPACFTRAFKKKFGIPPRKYLDEKH